MSAFRFVDFYTLPSHNLTAQSSNATYHHSRLMGVSDIGNAVRMTDFSPPRMLVRVLFIFRIPSWTW